MSEVLILLKTTYKAVCYGENKKQKTKLCFPSKTTEFLFSESSHVIASKDFTRSLQLYQAHHSSCSCPSEPFQQ